MSVAEALAMSAPGADAANPMKDQIARPQESHPDLDRVARALAASAGLVWDRLDHYPGYMRGIWRSEAAHLLGRMERQARGRD
jgi:hypothetical protein